MTDTTAPDDAPRCSHCGDAFPSERLRALHRGLEHHDSLDDDERAAFEDAYHDESEDLRSFRLRALAVSHQCGVREHQGWRRAEGGTHAEGSIRQNRECAPRRHPNCVHTLVSHPPEQRVPLARPCVSLFDGRIGCC